MLKRHIGNTIGIGLDMILFFLNNGSREGAQDVENVGYNVEGHQEIHKGCFWALVVGLKIFYI
jgi:hypothetical protein